jgi:hypothetical protein
VSGYEEGSVYGPIVRPDMNEYFAVLPDPLVDFYSQGFPLGTTLDGAENRVLDEFPEDAKVLVRDTQEPECTIILIQSKTRREAVGSEAIAACFSEQDPSDLDRTPLDPNDVSDATLFSDYEGKRRDLGFC